MYVNTSRVETDSMYANHIYMDKRFTFWDFFGLAGCVELII